MLCPSLVQVGRRVAVFWADDDAWYTGLVTAYSKKHRKHTVQYDDGDIEMKNLACAKYRWRYDWIGGYRWEG